MEVKFWIDISSWKQNKNFQICSLYLYAYKLYHIFNKNSKQINTKNPTYRHKLAKATRYLTKRNSNGDKYPPVTTPY